MIGEHSGTFFTVLILAPPWGPGFGVGTEPEKSKRRRKKINRRKIYQIRIEMMTLRNNFVSSSEKNIKILNKNSCDSPE